MIQTYDIHKSYAFNYERGPVFDGPPLQAPDGPMKSFLGRPVRSQLGIAAGLLLNGKWVAAYAQRGFDILTYKTVRSQYRPCYDPPNWVFIEEGEDPEGPVYATDHPPSQLSEVSSAVCFGMPSMAPEIWRADVENAKRSLGSGQLLIVSVVASPEPGDDADLVANDFRQCAEWAIEAGADAVEANFSCPNVCSPEGNIYTDAKLSRRVAEAIRRGIGNAPLLIKAGYLPLEESLHALLRELSGVANGITLVNGVTRPALRRNGQPVFGEQYRSAGIVGRAIHLPSVEQVRRARRIIDEDRLPLELVAVGGAGGVGEISDFFEVGATAVLMGSSPMYQPHLAIQARLAYPDW